MKEDLLKTSKERWEELSDGHLVIRLQWRTGRGHRMEGKTGRTVYLEEIKAVKNTHCGSSVLLVKYIPLGVGGQTHHNPQITWGSKVNRALTFDKKMFRYKQKVCLLLYFFFFHLYFLFYSSLLLLFCFFFLYQILMFCIFRRDLAKIDK